MKPENRETPIKTRLNAPETKIPRKPRTEDIRQGYRVVSSVPTTAPRNFYESIVIYVSGATKRLYVYNAKVGTWYYTALT